MGKAKRKAAKAKTSKAKTAKKSTKGKATATKKAVAKRTAPPKKKATTKKAATKKAPAKKKGTGTAKEANDLERIIAHLDTLYEQGDDCIHPDTGIIVTDGEYDGMRRRLRDLRPGSKLFRTATASKVDSGVKKVVHDPPLTSIEKASHEQVDLQEAMLFKWLDDCREEAAPKVQKGPHQTLKDKTYGGEQVSYPKDYFYHAYKLDGVAMALYYENGVLKAAGLRPRDGINGEDVTAQVKHVKGIPEKLKLKKTCSVRGELICRLSEFDKVQAELAKEGEKLRANPRNHAAGGIRQFKDPTKTKKMRLEFIAYTIEGLARAPYKTELERSKWCREKLGIPYVQTKKFSFADLAKMETNIPKLDFEVDGVVVGVNNLEDQEQLGRHGDPVTGNPKGKIAWKFREEEATPVIKSIEWQTGRTGKIVGVAVFSPVRLAGTNVTRATLHNAGFMQRNKIAIGAKISVRKAGKIIPKVTGVVSGQGKPAFPKKCPSCAKATKLVKGGSPDMHELVCENSACPAQNVSRLCHYLATFGVLGLAESRVAKLVEGGKVVAPADFYRLEVEDAVACGLSKRQSLLAVAAIHMIGAPDKLSDRVLQSRIDSARTEKKSIPLWQLFATFGIEAAGKSAGKALADHFGTFADIRKATVKQLEAVADIGEKTARGIHAYLKENKKAIDDLLKYVEPELPKTGKLSGKSFCFSGGFAEGKRHWEQEVENLGGKCGGSVSKKTDYLVAGPGSGSKSDKAKKLGVPILSIDELKKLL